MKPKVREPAQEHPEGKLVRDHDPRMGSPSPYPLQVHPRKIAAIVAEEDALGLGGKRELFLIRVLEVARFLGCKNVDAASSERSGQRDVYVLVEIKADPHRPSVRRTYSSLLASMSASISTW